MLRVTIEILPDNRRWDEKPMLHTVFEIKNQDIGSGVDQGSWHTAKYKYRHHAGGSYWRWLEWEKDAFEMDYKEYSPLRCATLALNHYQDKHKDRKHGIFL